MPTCVAQIGGRVQGVGFRPWVWRLAARLGVDGTVANTGDGVTVVAQGPRARELLERLRRQPPPLAVITSWHEKTVNRAPIKGFSIRASRNPGGRLLDATPDLALCPDCANEISSPSERRFGYAFTNCTQCGPRYTIINSLPYDRPHTTMAGFRLCPACRREYNSPSDRRFHAEPICCPDCGPALTALNHRGEPVTGEPLAIAVKFLVRGGIVAIKSLGGFQLACRADNDKAIARLRRLKYRPTKPLALMCASIRSAAKLVHLTPAGRSLLNSRSAPIVLLRRRPQAPVSPLIAPGTDRLGIMLPYTPLHQLLFNLLPPAIPALVMTSANPPGEPIALDESELINAARPAADVIITHNRPIANRADDSVVLAGRAPVVIRRARGYVPVPIQLAPVFHVKHPVLAAGADGRNAFALAFADRIVPGTYLGDMHSAGTEKFFLSALDRMSGWYRFRPKLVACDLHPDLFSTRLAETIAERYGARLVRVQHHLAHVLSVVAEHRLDEPVIGIAADGLGWGADGNVWGCELFLVKSECQWLRVGHLAYLKEAGGAAELADPARVAASYLAQTGEKRLAARLGLPCPPPTGKLLSSSLGRLFDAAAAITGVCRHASYEGEAAVRLETVAGKRLCPGWFRATDITEHHEPSGPLVTPGRTEPEPALSQLVWDPRYCLVALAAAAAGGEAPGQLAARFHHTVVSALACLARRLAEKHGAGTVALSGGAMVNSLLRRGITARLRRAGIRVLTNCAVPPNDGGIATGQALAAVLDRTVTGSRFSPAGRRLSLDSGTLPPMMRSGN